MQAEFLLAKGLAAETLESSIESLTRAGEVYPYDFRFRSAQARQLGLAGADLLPMAVESLNRAVAVDPGSIELLALAMATMEDAGDCDGAKRMLGRLIRLAPQFGKVTLTRCPEE